MHLIEVLYDDAPVPKSPFRVSVVEGCDPTRVRAYGPGLEGGITNKPNFFTVETRYSRDTSEMFMRVLTQIRAHIFCLRWI